MLSSTLVVTKLDRLARSIGHLSEITRALEIKKADLQVVAMGLDTSTATGRLMVNVIGSVAQFEREMMLERQREGIAKAKLDGKYKGRKPTARAKTLWCVSFTSGAWAHPRLRGKQASEELASIGYCRTYGNNQQRCLRR